MSENEVTTTKKLDKRTVMYIVTGALVILLIVLCIVFAHQRRQMKEMVEILELEKEELTDEYEDLSIQFDGYQQMDVHNDSLQEQLAIEQQRVRDLLEELRITKATNARRIAELKKELTTVRKVMVEYVRQIDSLNQTNERLTRENQHYKRENKQIVEQNTQLAEANTVLSETVTRASRLEVTNFSTTFLNERDKKTKRFSHIHKFQFDYSLGKNTTCEPGMKTIYMRLSRPDGELMTKTSSKMFTFESDDLQSSLNQEIEYSGEEMSSTMYWTVEEILYPGEYSVEFFAEGQHIGSFSFNLKK
ncbi:MAG: hypothetical protein K5660_06570 [Paludibacteraceae bacterium]|nr:hypothetical protein [Paludibacteraceae bacterium]